MHSGFSVSCSLNSHSVWVASQSMKNLLLLLLLLLLLFFESMSTATCPRFTPGGERPPGTPCRAARRTLSRCLVDSQPTSMPVLRAIMLVAIVAAEDVHIHTPLVWSSKLSERVGSSVYLKMDALQPGGSFKARGIGRLCTHFRDEGVTSLVSSSCANAGMAVAVAGRALGVEATIVASDVDRECRLLDTFRQLGANVVLHGAEWNDADAHARSLGASQGAASSPSPDATPNPDPDPNPNPNPDPDPNPDPNPDQARRTSRCSTTLSSSRATRA